MRIQGQSDEDRFWAKVDKSGGPDACWPWLGATHTKDFQYGRFRLVTSNEPGVGRTVYAHRHAVELTSGPIPDGLFACHECDNPPCCNPAHLFLGTNEDNMQDMAAKGRSAWGGMESCKRGHPFTPENTGHQKRGRFRFCRTCYRARANARAKRIREACQ